MTDLTFNTRALIVMPENQLHSAFMCPDCQRYLNASQEMRVLCGHTIKCLTCPIEKFLRIDTLDVAIRTDSYSLAIDPAIALSGTWYHSTSSTNWLGDVFQNTREKREVTSSNPALVHIGTLQAAQDRRAMTKSEHLYKVTCLRGSTVEPKLANDVTEFPQTVDRISHYTTANMVRYINRWESPGSVSLLADPRFLLAERIA